MLRIHEPSAESGEGWENMVVPSEPLAAPGASICGGGYGWGVPKG